MACQVIDKEELKIINSKLNEQIDETYEIVEIIYDSSNTRRFIIIKESENMYSYRLEFLIKVNNEYKWNPPCCCMSHSIFISKSDAINDLKLTDAYEKYFIF